MEPLVEVRDLRYRYEDGTTALDGVDFELYPGETVALVGPNGSGKTTFLLNLNGLLRGEGRIRICGWELNRATLTQVRRKVGLLFQDPDEQLFMPTVLEDVAFGPLAQGLPAAEAERLAREALARVGMTHAAWRAPHHLSAGEKRRVALAGVLAAQAEILALDEPTTYLDPPGRADLLTLLAGLPQAKIIATHDLWFAKQVATRAVFLRDGRVVDQGAVTDVARHFNLPPGLFPLGAASH